MYKQIYNDKNAKLFNKYAWFLYKMGQSRQDYLKSEKYFLKSLSIDSSDDSTHNNYPRLLETKLYNYKKAEFYYYESLRINPHQGMMHANFALFLINKREKYRLALSHSEKSCKLKPNVSFGHFVKAQALYKLNMFNESLKESEKCIQLHKNDGLLLWDEIWCVKKQIQLLTSNTGNNDGKSKQCNHGNHDQSQLSIRTSNDSSKKAMSSNKTIDNRSSKSRESSIIDGIDWITVKITEIQQMIADNNVNINIKSIKNDLSIVERQLSIARTKCNNIGLKKTYASICNVNGNNSMKTCDYNYKYDELRSGVGKLNEKIEKGKELSLLIELKKLEQEIKFQHEKTQVIIFVAC